jgi:hypothetical protein
VHNVVHMANVVVVASVTVTKLSKSSVRLGVVSQQFVHAVDCAPRTSALGSITHGILSCARLTTGTDVSNVMHAARYFPQFLFHRDGSRCTAPLGASLPYCQSLYIPAVPDASSTRRWILRAIEWEQVSYTDQATPEPRQPTIEDSILAMKNACNAPDPVEARHRDGQGLAQWTGPRQRTRALIAQ